MMASTFDVAGRLAEGEHALTELENYVAACQVLGLPGPEASLSQLYHAESGLELAALAADGRALRTAAVAADDVLQLQDNGTRQLMGQWSGLGGGAAGEYLRRQVVTARAVVAQLQRSAEALTVLRDELWRAVDAKVAAVLRVDAQVAGHRAEWTAAARAVVDGIGDLATASEVVDQQIKPFVDRVVCDELLRELQTASDAVVAAYDSAICAATPATVSFGVPQVVFAVSGLFGGSAAMPDYRVAAAPSLGAAAGAAPWSSPGSAAPGAAPAMAAESVAPAAPPLTSPAAAPEPAPGASSASPAGLPGDIGLGSGVSGLGQQLADAIGGVLGSVAGLAPGASGLGAGLGDLADARIGLADRLAPGGDGADPAGGRDGAADDGPESSESDNADKPDEAGKPEESGPQADTDETPDPSTDEASAPDADPPITDPPITDPPAPTPPPEPVAGSAAPLPVEPVAMQENPTAKTPCQIAADELPQVGE